MAEKVQDKKVELNVGEIELPKLDMTPYVGKKAKIETADTYQGQYGMYVKVQTKTIDLIGKGKNAIELRGSRIFGLQQDAEGTWGFGAGTKLGVFLAKMKCKKPSDLIGKEVVLQSQTNDNGTDFLTFN